MADDAGLINEVLKETSFLSGGNADYVEALYAKWAAAPLGVEPSWGPFFASLQARPAEVKRPPLAPAWTRPEVPPARPEWLSAIDGLWPAVEAKVGVKIAE